MTQHITASRGDIVVVVPRWLIAAAGLVMLLAGLSVSFFFLVVGLVTEGLFLSLAVLVLVPLQLFLAYITWRFYWYLMVLGTMVSMLMACTLITGVARIGGNTYSLMYIAPGTSVLPVGNQLALSILIAFGLAFGATVLAAFVLSAVMSLSTPAAPTRKARQVEEYPSLDSPEWDDPQSKRRPRDLWKDSR